MSTKEMNIMTGIIDRFEGDYVILELENRIMDKVPRNQIPDCAKEGDVIIKINGIYRVDEGETQRRKRELEVLSQDLWE
jgi:hypothetical protein